MTKALKKMIPGIVCVGIIFGMFLLLVILYFADDIFGEINIYKMKSVTQEGKFLFSAVENNKGKLYICDLATDTYELKYSSENYSIKYFCIEGDLIYFLGESEGKTDIVKLDDEKEETLAALEQNAYGIGKIGEKLFFVMGPNEEEIYIYYFDLKTFEVIKYSEKSFIFKGIYNPVFCPDGDIFIFSNEKLNYVNIIYLIRGNDIINLGVCHVVQKYNGNIFGSFYEKSKSYNGINDFCIDEKTGYYDLNTGKTQNIKKYSNFSLGSYLDISKDNKYGLAFGVHHNKRYFFRDPAIDYVYLLTVYNMNNGKQAAIKCLTEISNNIYCWRWLETA